MPKPESTLEAWKRFLLTLPDSSFFSIAKHYLGELKTPFTKQQILADLVSQLLRPDWKQVRRDLLTDEDLELLTAISILDFPNVGELADFLGVPHLTVTPRVLNLEERMLVFSTSSVRGNELGLSPLVVDDPEIASLLHSGRLYSSTPVPHVVDSSPDLHEGTLLSLLSFLLEVPLERSATGTWKKKARVDFLERFASLKNCGEVVGADRLLACAVRLGLVSWSEGKTQLILSYWNDLKAQKRDDRLALLWTSAGPWELQQLFEAARWFWSFVNALSPKRAYPLSTLIRLSGRIAAWGTVKQRTQLFEEWISWGLLVPSEVAGSYQIPLSVLEAQKRSQRSAQSYLQGNFELSWPHDIDLVEGWCAGMSTRLVRWDRIVKGELSKSAVSRCYLQGETASTLQDQLVVLTGKPLSQNISFSLSEWEREFQALRLWKGTVLTVDPGRRHLIEHTEHFKKAVVHVLGEGIYLVRDDVLREWSKELEHKGLPSLPPIHQSEDDWDWGSPWTFTGWTSQKEALEIDTAEEPVPPDTKKANAIVENLEVALASVNRSEDEKEELRWRMRRKLVLSTEQLNYPVGKGERMEAKGLDYVGKLRLVEQALASNFDLLEIVSRNSEGHPEVWLVRPVKTEKQGSEIALVADGVQPAKPFRAYISRISHIKKIRGSLLG